MTTTTTITMQPSVLVAPETKVNLWSSGLCDCCDDMSVCCLGFWCPYCLMCNTSQEFGENLCLPLLDCCLGFLIPPATYAMRSTMRERYRIQGTMCDDCCIVTCCGMCAWCQMARELKFRRQHQVIVNPTVNLAHQVLPSQPYPTTLSQPYPTTLSQPYQHPLSQPYQQPPLNPSYQPNKPNSPPPYGQHAKSDPAQSAALYPAMH